MINCKSALLGMLLIALFPSQCVSGEIEVTEPAAGWSIQGGQVEMLPGDKPLVSGTFTVSLTQPVNDLLPSPRQGGACLLADLVPWGIGRASCTTKDDCNGPDAIDKIHNPGLATYIGYCVARDGSAEAPRCWTRPGPAHTHCKRTKDTLRLTAGMHSLGPVDADPLGNGEPYPEWAVYACMAQPGHEGACGQAESPYRQVSLTPLPSGDE